MGDLFEEYQKKGGSKVYKTFQRKVESLAKNRFVSAEKTSGGKDGNTTIVRYEKTKKLTEF